MSELPNKHIEQAPESYGPKTRPEIISQAENLTAAEFPASYMLVDKGVKLPPGIKHYGPAYAGFGNEFAQFLDYTGQGYGFIYDGDWCKDRGYTIADVMTGHAMEPACLFFPEQKDYLWKIAGFSLHDTFYADPAKKGYMSEPDMKDAIKYALCVLEQPVIMPQSSHWWGSLIIGYKGDGNVLVLRHYLPYFIDRDNNAQPKTEEITGWYKQDISLFIAGKREKALSLVEIYREGIFRIRDCLAENIRGQKRRYYDEWETFLLMSKEEMMAEVTRTGYVPGGCDGCENGKMKDDIHGADIWEKICTAHNSTWCDMAERRFYVMNFFRQAKEFFPELKDDLQALDDQFWRTSVVMGGNDGNGYGTEIGDPCKPDVFADPEVRARMADCVRRLREADAKGLEMVEQLCERLYGPKTKPDIISMTEELCAEKVLETVTVEDVEFTIIEKAKTLYAGSYFVAPDINSEPDVEAIWKWYGVNHTKIVDSVTPDCMICLSIDYATSERPCAMLHGQETTNPDQPEGVHVLAADPTLLIRVKSTPESWALTKKLTGSDNPQWHMSPLFHLIRRIFESEDEFNGCKGRGNEETEYYHTNGEQYVTVPVSKKSL
ncbi:MAG: hypothetical protein FWD16_03385 [Clostridia bacterium]|nr:hypothetical protein [Clostridia bacterium]